MKIKTLNKSNDERAPKTQRIDEYVLDEVLYGDDNTDIENQLERSVDSLGRLCEVLTQKGVLDAQELVYVATGLSAQSQENHGYEASLIQVVDSRKL